MLRREKGRHKYERPLGLSPAGISTLPSHPSPLGPSIREISDSFINFPSLACIRAFSNRAHVNAGAHGPALSHRCFVKMCVSIELGTRCYTRHFERGRSNVQGQKKNSEKIISKFSLQLGFSSCFLGLATERCP